MLIIQVIEFEHFENATELHRYFHSNPNIVFYCSMLTDFISFNSFSFCSFLGLSSARPVHWSEIMSASAFPLQFLINFELDLVFQLMVIFVLVFFKFCLLSVCFERLNNIYIEIYLCAPNSQLLLLITSNGLRWKFTDAAFIFHKSYNSLKILCTVWMR